MHLKHLHVRAREDHACTFEDDHAMFMFQVYMPCAWRSAHTLDVVHCEPSGFHGSMRCGGPDNACVLIMHRPVHVDWEPMFHVHVLWTSVPLSCCLVCLVKLRWEHHGYPACYFLYDITHVWFAFDEEVVEVRFQRRVLNRVD